MTNFFQQQRDSRSRSKKIVGLFLLFIVIQFIGTYFVYKNALAPILYSYDMYEGSRYNISDNSSIDDIRKPKITRREVLINKHSLLFSGLLALFFLIIYFSKKAMYLSRPHKIPNSMGAKEITSHTTDAKEKMYYNIVSEMSLASGVPMPKIYLLTQEKSINAFTSGHDYQSADITVTQGALEKFTRDELQAVVAHEFGHIVSGDVKASVHLLSVIFSFSIIYTVGLYILRAMGRSSRSSRKGKGGGQLMLVAVAVVVIGYVGFIISRIITAFFSREREYLADSLSVQFTRYPAGLASSLAKIRDNMYGSVLDNEKGKEIASICFSSSFKSFSSLLSSHPPIKNRIKRLDSKFLEVGSSFETPVVNSISKGSSNHKSMDMNKTMEYMMGMGILTDDNKNQALSTLTKLNDKDISSYLNEDKVEALAYALLLSKSLEVSKKQLHIIKTNCDEEVLISTKELYEKFSSSESLKSISILDLMVPSLTSVSVYNDDKILKLMTQLIEADGKKVSYESFIFCFIKKYLVGSWKDSKKPTQKDLIYLLANMSELDDEPDLAAKKEALTFFYGKEVSISDYNKEDDLEFVLGRLSRLNDKNKEKLIEALLIAIRFDGKVTREEFESFRVVCDFLEVPAPPLKID